MAAPTPQATWIEFSITCVGNDVLVGMLGSRGERHPPRPLGIGRDRLLQFAAAIERAAARGRPIADSVLADARAIQKALLDGDTGVRFGQLCEAGGRSLLVKFVVDDTALQAVPWEAVCKTDEALGFWGTAANVFPVRTVASREAWQPRGVSGAIKVLAIAPTGGAGLANLKHALAERIDTGDVEWLEPVEGSVARVPAIFDRLRCEPIPHVIHFLGHGGVDAQNRPALRMADDDGEETWLAAEVLAQQLKAHFRDNLRLIVLEACEGAKPAAFASAAEVLAKAGADAVVAHLWPVRADVARTCSTQFYRALTTSTRGAGDVAFAANEARRTILGAFHSSAEALGPVVVLRGPNGKIFDFEQRSATEVRPSETLPAIMERLPAGEEGRQEFADLVGGLIRIYSGIPKFQRHHGPLCHPEGKHIHRIGISFPGRHDEIFVVWPNNDIRHGEIADELTERIAQLLPYDDYEFEESGKKTFPFIFPRYLTTAERAWLEAQPKAEVTVAEARDMAHVAELLEPYPAILARYYPEIAAKILPGFVPFDFLTFARKYCAEIVRDKQYVHLLGFPPDALREKDAKAHIRLADLFVPTVFREQSDRDNRTALSELLKDERSVVVLGDPGMGKTTLLTFLALLNAGGGAKLEGYEPPPKRIPLFVSLREYAVEEQKHNLSLLDYLAKRAESLPALREAHPAFFEALLHMEEAIVLLDGLDEVGASVARKRIADRVRDLRREYPNCPIWVASRIHGYTHDVALPPEEFHHVMIGALDDAQVDDFLNRWYTIQIPNDPQKQAERKNSLRQAIFRTKQVRALATNPLLLTLMAFVHRILGHLPQDRGELYEQCVTMLLRNWLEARERPEKHAFECLGLAKELPRMYLEALAFHVQENGLLVDDQASDVRGLFSRDDALAFLTKHHLENDRRTPSILPLAAREEMREFVDYACDRVGLLVDRGGGKLSFLHLSFQEYLAASHETVMTTIREQEMVFVKHFRDAAWTEVLLLRLYLFACKRGRVGQDLFDELVRVLLDELDRNDDLTGWLLLGRALRDRHDVRQNQRRIVLDRLVCAWAAEPAFEGDVFVALEDIRVFATDVVQSELRAACARLLSNGSAGEAIAALHLEEKLFGGVDGAAKRLGARADASALLVNLVAFVDVPEIAALLAERSTPDHWETAFSALNGEEVYRWTLGWATGLASCPVRSDAPLAGAVQWMRRKINEEVESREQFAERFPDCAGAPLFSRPGSIRVDEKHFAFVLPLAYATISHSRRIPIADLVQPALHSLLLFRQRFDKYLPELLHTCESPLGEWIADIVNRLSRSVGESLPVRSAEFSAIFATTVIPTLIAHFHQYPTRYDVFMQRELHGDDFRHRVVRGSGGCFRINAFDVLAQFTHSEARHLIGECGNHYRPKIADIITRQLLEALGYNCDGDGALQRIHHNIWFDAITPGNAVFHVTESCDRIFCKVERTFAVLQALIEVCAISLMTWFLAIGRHLHVLYPNGDFPEEAWNEWIAKNPIWSFWSALGWNEHAKLFQQNHGKLDGAVGALMLAHADYASLMTGLDLENAIDYPAWKALVEAVGTEQIDELRHFASAPEAAPAQASAPVHAPKPARVVEPSPLFTYLHLSDMHFGLPHAGDRHHQSTVLAALRDEFANWSSRSLPRPDAIFITGDIAWAGKTSDYEVASKWLDEVLTLLGLARDRVFVVPGNHDVDRSKTTDRMSRLLLGAVRESEEDLDDVLHDESSRAVLLRRKEAYLEFAKRFAPACHYPDQPALQRLAWTHREQARDGLAVHVVGFDTALLAAGDDDPKKLRLGQAQIALLNDCAPDREFVIVLGHHPLNKEWLHPNDEADAARQLRRRAHVYLTGHVHDHASERVISGGGAELLHVVAGATYGGRQEHIPQGHAYSVGAVMPPFEGQPMRVRVYPRKFSFKQGDFRTDVDNVPEGKTFTEFELKNLNVERMRDAIVIR